MAGLQLRYDTGLTGEEYVRAEAWRDARLERCPNHPHGGCSVARHGTYRRKTPPGAKVPRWYCRESHTTIGLLADCLASHLPGTLAELEAVVGAAEGAASLEAAANELRPPEDDDAVALLRNDALKDLRLLTNFAMDSENRMCLILVGLTELRRRLSMAVHESLAQRLVVRHHLAGLGRDEVDAYVRHRLGLAGCELPLFEETAVEALFQATRGLPRQAYCRLGRQGARN